MSPAALRASPAAPCAQDWAAELLETGYCIIPDAAPLALVKALSADLDDRFHKTPFCEGGFYGRRTKRFHGLLKRSRYAAAFVANPLILEVVDQILAPHCDTWQLNLTQALELHPGQRAQAPHRDQDMWRGAAGNAEYLVNVMWPFNDYTAQNGATVIWPGSHKRLEEQMIDPAEAVTAGMGPGSALLFLGSTLHGGGGNVSSNSVRRGMIISYCLGWLKPYENQWLTYPPAIARTFPPELAALVGYREHRPNLGNYDGQDPSVLLRGEPEEYMAAIDNLRPDQIELLAEYIAATGGPDEDGAMMTPDFSRIASACELEEADVELAQAIALLRAIEEGEMFGASPTEPSARRRHEAGVTLLAMVQPRLERVLFRLRSII